MILSPKEKAIELVEMFGEHSNCIEIFSLDHDPNDEIRLKEAMQCALICVNEIIKSNPTTEGTGDDGTSEMQNDEYYWEEVKREIEQEIEKL